MKKITWALMSRRKVLRSDLSPDMDLQSFLDQRDPRIEAFASMANILKPIDQQPFEFYPQRRSSPNQVSRKAERFLLEPALTIPDVNRRD